MPHQIAMKSPRASRPTVTCQQDKYRGWHAGQYHPQNPKPHKNKTHDKKHPTQQGINMQIIFGRLG